jgi:hypothetical protein
MLNSDLPQPTFTIRCGELHDRSPEAYEAFGREFVVDIVGQDFTVDAERRIHFIPADHEHYRWNPVLGRWEDLLPDWAPPGR